MTKQLRFLLRLPLALVLAVGFAGAWFVLIGWLVTGLAAAYSTPGTGWGQLMFRADGTPIVRDGPATYHDLIGKAVPGPKNEEDKDWLLPGFYYLTAGEPEPSVQGRATWDRRLQAFDSTNDPADQGNQSSRWFFVADGNSPGFAYLVGYDPESRSRIGFLGTRGFRAAALPPAEQFPFSSADRSLLPSARSALYTRLLARYGQGYFIAAPDGTHLFIFVWADDDKIYRVDLRKRSVAVVLEETGLQAVATETRWFGKDPSDKVLLAARRNDAVLLLNGLDGTARRFPIPTGVRHRDFYFWGALPDGASVVCTLARGELGTQPSNNYEVFWIDRAGKVTKQLTTALPIRQNIDMRIVAGIIAPSFIIVGPALAMKAAFDNPESPYPEALAAALRDFWPSLLILLFLSTLLAWACHRRQVRRHAAGHVERLLWPIFVFLFGIPGWVGYRYCRSWPVLERCLSCGQVVPRDAERCAACKVDFPLPALKSSEVIA